MYDVLRLDMSPYQSPDFRRWEKELVEGLGLNYLTEYRTGPRPLILLTNSGSDLTKASRIVDFNRVEMIIHPNSGFDNFSPEFVDQHNFPILIGHKIRAQAVADYILSCILQHYTMPPWVQRWDPSRAWDRSLLQDKTALVIGRGHIGELLMTMLEPLVKKIFINDPYRGHDELPLEESSMVLLTCGLNKSSHHMVDTKFLNRLCPNVLLVNAARGKLINEVHLINFLQQNPESYAYLDVFEKEPFYQMTFQAVKNIKLSSHVAGVFNGLDRAILDFEKEILTAFLEKNPSIPFVQKFRRINLQYRLREGMLI